MTATDLKKRAIALAEKTKIDSVTPEEVGQLSNDIVEYIENVEINGSSLGIRKTYTSVSAMEADSTAPKDDKGVLLRRGMLVNIYNQSDPDSADNGKVFSFQNPGWTFRGTVDAGYATKEELTELESKTEEIKNTKQDNLTFDKTPTLNSPNPVTSGGIKEALDLQKNEVEAAKDEALNSISERESSAILNFNKQKVTPEMLSQSVKDLINTAGGGTINNMPDEEDIQSVDDGTGSQVLKFNDRAYNPSNFSGKGYKILRKNIVDGKNVLTQEMINQENTVYEIRYDFDLNGAEITIPKGCTLKFSGGSLRNGVLIGNNSIIESKEETILYDVSISGTWDILNIFSVWIQDANPNKMLKNIFSLQNEFLQNNIYLSKNNLEIDLSNNENLVEIKSNLSVYCPDFSIKIRGNSNIRSNVFLLSNISNVNFCGGTFIGDIDTHVNSSEDSTDEWNHCFKITKNCKNINIISCNISNFHGDGIDIIGVGEYYPQNINIDSVSLDNNGRQGISIESGFNVFVKNSTITNTGTIKLINPSAGIDVEPFTDTVLENIYISNCTIKDNKGKYDLDINTSKLISYLPKNINVTNCNIGNLRILDSNDINISDTTSKNLYISSATKIQIRNSPINNVTLYESEDIKIYYSDIYSDKFLSINGISITGGKLRYIDCRDSSDVEIKDLNIYGYTDDDYKSIKLSNITGLSSIINCNINNSHENGLLLSTAKVDLLT